LRRAECVPGALLPRSDLAGALLVVVRDRRAGAKIFRSGGRLFAKHIRGTHSAGVMLGFMLSAGTAIGAVPVSRWAVPVVLERAIMLLETFGRVSAGVIFHVLTTLFIGMSVVLASR